jgi:hypothetical protein
MFVCLSVTRRSAAEPAIGKASSSGTLDWHPWDYIMKITDSENLFLCNNTNACQFCFLSIKNDYCLTSHAQGYMIHYQLHYQLLPELLKKRRGNSSYFSKGVVAEFDYCEIQGWWQQLWYAFDFYFIILAYEALKALIFITDLSGTCSAMICNPQSLQ